MDSLEKILRQAVTTDTQITDIAKNNLTIPNIAFPMRK